MDKDKRKERNKNLIERMRRNEPLNLYEPTSTFFPPRPRIAKNKKDIERLYGVTAVIGEVTNDKSENSESDSQMPDRT